MERAGKLLATSKTVSRNCSQEELAKGAWTAAVGRRIARRARFLCLRDSRLVIEVDDIVWRSHIETLRPQILRNLISIAGPNLITGLQVQVGICRRPPQSEENYFALEPLGCTRPRAAAGTDEADTIADPVFRRLYIQARRRALG